MTAFLQMNQRRFVPGTFIGIVFFHLLALAAPFTFTWPGLILFGALAVLTGFGITLGYHRLFTHQSYQTSRPIKYILAFFACLALQGGPIRWVATHRLHHKDSDTPADPHTPSESFLWGHLLWNFYRHPKLETDADLKRIAPDLHADPVMRFFNTHFFTLFLAAAALAFTVGTFVGGWQLGLSLVVWGFALRTVYGWHTTWLVNSATHMWGYRTYDTTDNSRNTWWVALLTYGEGWHNNHHAFQRSARMGLQWFELDPTYWIIAMLSRLGLAHNVILKSPDVAPPSVISKPVKISA